MLQLRKASLEVITPQGRQSVPLADRPMTLGRADGCDIVIAEPFVSACHARIEPDGEGYVVRDAGSTVIETPNIPPCRTLIFPPLRLNRQGGEHGTAREIA